jgi:hypothetical protein
MSYRLRNPADVQMQIQHNAEAESVQGLRQLRSYSQPIFTTKHNTYAISRIIKPACHSTEHLKLHPQVQDGG